MKRKLVVISFVLVMLVGLIGGCNTRKQPLSASSVAQDWDGENAAMSGLLEQKSEVVISIDSEPSTLDPCKEWGHGTTPLIQSTLVEYHQDRGFINDLATDYRLSDDGLVWTFTIRDDVTFTDGEALTASDVAFTLCTAKDNPSALDLTFLDHVEVVDDVTVRFILTKPTSTFLNTVSSIGIVPEHAYGPEYGDAPIGSGPYRFVQWNRQEQLILEANEDYYGTVPAIKKVVIVFQDEDAAFAAVKAGQVDVALTAATLAKADISGYSLNAVTTADNRGLTLPMSPNEGKRTSGGQPYGNDVTCHQEIRQAMAYAIDREMIAQMALNGFATPCWSENDGLFWNNPEVRIDTDIEYAKRLLADAGWEDIDGDGILEKDSLKAQFTCVYPSGDSVRQAVAMAAAEQLKAIGIHMTVEGTSWDDINKRMFCDVVCMGWGSSDPYTSYCLFHSSNMLQDDYYNPEGFCDEKVDCYLEAALVARTTEEANQYWKLAQWDGTSGTSMKGACPWVWLVNVQHLYYVRNGLDIGQQQLHPHGSSMPLLQNLREWTWVDLHSEN